MKMSTYEYKFVASVTFAALNTTPVVVPVSCADWRECVQHLKKINFSGSTQTNKKFVTQIKNNNFFSLI